MGQKSAEVVVPAGIRSDSQVMGSGREACGREGPNAKNWSEGTACLVGIVNNTGRL